MDHAHRTGARRWRFLGAVAATTILLGTSIVSGAATSTVPLGNPFGYTYGYRSAVTEVAKLYADTSTPVDTTPRPAATNKFVVIISAGQSSISNSEPVNAAAAAAQAIGWRSRVLDAKLQPSTYADLVRKAITLRADGIVLDGIDCDQVRGPLQQAKAHHIAVIPLDAYDCDDPTENAGRPLFSAVVNVDNLSSKHFGDFAESFGRAEADYIIAASHNKARVLLLNDPGVPTLRYSAAGFDDQLAHSKGSAVVATVNFQAADLGPTLVQEIRAALRQHPDVNWIKSPDTYATILGVVPALAASPRFKYHVMGGDGFGPELTDISAGSVTATLATSPQWTGWAAIDAMNSVFTHRPVYPSGIGWELIDATHNLPPDDNFVPEQNYQAAYEQAWGVKT